MDAVKSLHLPVLFSTSLARRWVEFNSGRSPNLTSYIYTVSSIATHFFESLVSTVPPPGQSSQQLKQDSNLQCQMRLSALTVSYCRETEIMVWNNSHILLHYLSFNWLDLDDVYQFRHSTAYLVGSAGIEPATPSL